MGKRVADDALYWRSIRLAKVNLIRYALQQTGDNIKAAASHLGISEGGLRKEIYKLEAFGLHVRDVAPKAAPAAPVKAAPSAPTEEPPQVGSEDPDAPDQR